MPHPYFRTPKAEQHETARERQAAEARAFLARKAEQARKMVGRRILIAA
jgi:hypothetical protein